MLSLLHSARTLAPLMVLALVLPALGPAVAQLCHAEAPTTACCHDRCSMKHAPKPTGEHDHQPDANGPVAKPCCAPAAEASAPAPTIASVQDQLVATVALLPADVTAALRVPPPVRASANAESLPPPLRSHLAISVLLI